MNRPASGSETALLWPFDLTVNRIAAFANAEFPDHPIYGGFELQWFDDSVHGTGLLAFLTRREDGRVDYYVDPSLRLDPSGYHIGGGIGEWQAAEFEIAELEVGPDGTFADVRFRDVDGRPIEVAFDDRDREKRRTGVLLAPFGADIDDPTSLMLVYVHGFDLLRRGTRPPLILIDGRPVSTGKLPGGFLHRRHLIKSGSPLTVATLCRSSSDRLEPVDPADPGNLSIDGAGEGIVAIADRHDGGSAAFVLDPPLPPLGQLEEGEAMEGDWRVEVDDADVTGGTWRALRKGTDVDLELNVTQPWTPPAGLPMLIRVVTRIIPVFRRWPTSYRWKAKVDLSTSPAVITSAWERTGTGGSETYRRSTQRSSKSTTPRRPPSRDRV